jgi:hypothetical protein
MRRTYHGSCHCGAVRFECEIDLAQGTSKCSCSICGLKPFAQGHMDELGGAFYAVNVACLDDATTAELTAAPVRYEDGKNDKWGSRPCETRHL